MSLKTLVITHAVDHLNELATVPAARAGVDIYKALANHLSENYLFEVLISEHGHNWSLKPIGWKQYVTRKGKAGALMLSLSISRQNIHPVASRGFLLLRSGAPMSGATVRWRDDWPAERD